MTWTKQQFHQDFNSNPYHLRRTREEILERQLVIGHMNDVPLDQISEWVPRTVAVHHLIRRVVRMQRDGPRGVPKEPKNSTISDKSSFCNRAWSYLHLGNFLTDSHILYCLVFSTNVNPSSYCKLVEQVLPFGHLHCFSIHGVSYRSTLLHMDFALHNGSSSSEDWNGTTFDQHWSIY